MNLRVGTAIIRGGVFALAPDVLTAEYWEGLD